jgi:hypothetical protein
MINEINASLNPDNPAFNVDDDPVPKVVSILDLHADNYELAEL